MPIPNSRAELIESINDTFNKLQNELDAAGPRSGILPCIDDWTVKDLLAVRVWWTEHVVRWVEAGKRGGRPVTPKEGYRWNETPRLNDDIVKKAGGASFKALRARLERGYREVIETIESLSDKELLGVGEFAWAGKYPIARWISINTARQYTTARTFIRRALRDQQAAAS